MQNLFFFLLKIIYWILKFKILNFIRIFYKRQKQRRAVNIKSTNVGFHGMICIVTGHGNWWDGFICILLEA